MDEVDGELKSVTLQIWDTAGQERFQSLGRAFYRGAEACILVFDITNKQSFDNLLVWKQEFLDKSMPQDPSIIPFFVLGNKVDLESSRTVPQTLIQEFLVNNPTIIYYETSALDGSNVNEVFASVAQNHLKIQAELKSENKES